jgi:tetratricopeptide (TPR) repeat protein
LGSPHDGDIILQRELEAMANLPNSIEESVRNRIHIDLLTRRCVCLKDMGQYDLATAIGEKAFELAELNHFKDLACLALIDLSAINKNTKSNKSNYIRSLQRAIRYFGTNQTYIEDESIQISCMENEARLSDLLGDTDRAISLADCVISYSIRGNDIYYLLRGLSIKAIILTRKELAKKRFNVHSLKIIQLLIHEIEDIAIVSRFDKFYLKALHLQAIISIVRGDNYRAKALLFSAFEKIDFRHPRHLSPEIEGLILDAYNFAKSTDILNELPLPRWVLTSLNISSVPTKFTTVPALKMLFCDNKFNYPFE